MTDNSFQLNCPRCHATLTVPGRPKRDVVVQCSQCGHQGRLPRKQKGSRAAPVVLKAADPTASAPPADGPKSQEPQRSFAKIGTSVLVIAVVAGTLLVVNQQGPAPQPNTPVKATANPAPAENVVTNEVSLEAKTTASVESEDEFIVRDQISSDEMFRRIRNDLENNVSRFATLFTRYFTITHLHNSGVTDDQLANSRMALFKLLNSLSWAREPYVPAAIDTEQTIYRIDLRELRWATETWQAIHDDDPYAFAFTNADAAVCADLTDDSVFFIRGDWFITAASRSPLYERILDLPRTLDEMASQLRVNIADNIESRETLRAGFRNSAETIHNRVIERHKTPYGGLWISYNFAGDTDQRNIFDYPLGPGSQPDQFRHDHAQAIFHLPNGLVAFMNFDAAGQSTSHLPASVFHKSVVENQRHGAASCMNCHSSGILPHTDEINIAVRTNRTAYEYPDLIVQLYANDDRTQKLQADDRNRFLNAVASLNLPDQASEAEAISQTVRAFDADLNIRQIAAELGVTAADLKTQLTSDNKLKSAVGEALATDGKLSRPQLLTHFGDIGEALGLGRSTRKSKSIVIASNDVNTTLNHSRTPPLTPSSTTELLPKAATTPETEVRLPELFGSGRGASIVSFDGQNVTYKDQDGIQRVVAIDELSANDQEQALSHSNTAQGALEDLPSESTARDQPTSRTPTPTTRGDLLTSGKATLQKFDGRDNVTIRMQDGRSETLSIDSLSSADVELVLQQNASGTSSTPNNSDDLPGANTPDNIAPNAADDVRPDTADKSNLWHGTDGKPLIEGKLDSMDGRRGIVRIAPTPRTWNAEGRTLEAVFHVASSSADGQVEVQIRRVGADRADKFNITSLSKADQQYLDMIRRGLESGQLTAVRSFSLKYWQIPIKAFSEADRQRILAATPTQP